MSSCKIAGREKPRKRTPCMIPDLKTQFAFQIRIDFKERVIMESPRGNRGYVPPTGGWVDGPRLKGKVLGYTGADWAWTRPDGVLELNAHYMLEAEDGTPIYIQNRGYLYRHDASGSRRPGNSALFLHHSDLRRGEGQARLADAHHYRRPGRAAYQS